MACSTPPTKKVVSKKKEHSNHSHKGNMAMKAAPKLVFKSKIANLMSGVK